MTSPRYPTDGRYPAPVLGAAAASLLAVARLAEHPPLRPFPDRGRPPAPLLPADRPLVLDVLDELPDVVGPRVPGGQLLAKPIPLPFDLLEAFALAYERPDGLTPRLIRPGIARQVVDAVDHVRGECYGDPIHNYDRMSPCDRPRT